MKNNLFLLLALAALALAGCGPKNEKPPAAAAPAPEKATEAADSEFDEAPALDEEGSREW